MGSNAERAGRCWGFEFITIHSLCYTVSPMKGGTRNGWLTVHGCAVPPHGVSGFDERDTRRVSAPRLALRDRVPRPYGSVAPRWKPRTAHQFSIYKNCSLPTPEEWL